ncbi:uncharacterized protein LOC103384894 [Cynoglossus semilaevis]|uniref:uncharacterized protein LOC103384894 n=1 Tax=Cynoglossus semilaevis TaxID=244447 RepID=UPI0004982B55|nr:uncharacterized protein LOC103384894 [Cynoglossus semilaevis]
MALKISTSCVCSFVFGTILIIAFPMAEITLGALHLNECPAAPLIPVYVMVCGIIALLLMGLVVLPKLLCPAAQGLIWTCCVLTLILLTFIWFLVGSYYIYSIYPPSYEKNITDPDKSISGAYTAPNSSWTQALHKHNHNLQTQDHDHLNRTFPNHNQTETMSGNQTWKNLIPTPTTSSDVDKEQQEPAADQAEATKAYCDKTLYLLAFWATTMIYVFAGNALLIMACLYGCMGIMNMITNHLF